MKTLHKIKTLLTDLRDKAQRRQWHVECLWCRWEVHNLEHKRFADARGKMHHTNAHGFVGPYRPIPERCKVWSTRA